jgi:shikimate dehydrogenase
MSDPSLSTRAGRRAHMTSPNGRCLVGLVGAGITDSLSPALHEAEADRLGLRYVYQVIDLDELELGADAIGQLLSEAQRMGFRGLNVTHPCKQVVVEWLDELAPEAIALGAVNTVVFRDGRTVGHNTDLFGFRESFARGLPGAPLDRVVLIGAGGAGAAVAHALMQLGTSRLTILDADPRRAVDLAEAVNRHFNVSGVEAAAVAEIPRLLMDADGVVHATPTGMAAHPGTVFERKLLRADIWVAEVVYVPFETELLRQAKAAGCRTLDGGGMAVFQAVESFRLFTGLDPDPDHMLGRFDQLVQKGAPADLLAPR